MPHAAKMTHLNIPRPPKGNCLMLLLKIWVIGVIMLGKVNSEDQMGAAPEAGSPCISDCATCPVICSPPSPTFVGSRNPPPFEYSYSPPSASHHSRPPESYHHSLPTRCPPPPPLPKSTQSPPWYPSWGNPPPPNYYYNTPMGEGPPSPGQHPYPFYYFYASKASSLSFITLLLSLVLFFHGLY